MSFFHNFNILVQGVQCYKKWSLTVLFSNQTDISLLYINVENMFVSLKNHISILVFGQDRL